VGFRGKERPQERRADNSTENLPPRDGPVRRSADSPLLSTFRGRLTSDGWRNENNTSRPATASEPSSVSSTPRLRRGKKDIGDDRHSSKRPSRAARFNDSNHSFGNQNLERRSLAAAPAVQWKEGGLSIRKARPDSDSEVPGGRRRPQITLAAWRAAESDRIAQDRNPSGSKLSKGRLAYLARVGASSTREALDGPSGQPDHASTQENYPQPSRNKEAWSRSADTERQPRFHYGRFAEDSNFIGSPFSQANSDRLPLSIPYTTPASEFLYGTSVVESALKSQRTPRRKLYKLYVYTSENREHAERDAGIERLARKSGVEVVHADTSWLRLLDKMSGGRPHNGYILEASPLPRLPITSLGELTSQDGKAGFFVSPDHQSREEAAINGTSNFIPFPCDIAAQGNRKPFVLLLDSILDPGNLGGIIRTASFLGVTAIAISSRNSASFSPVALKASAGASENITLFSINKPAGFIVDSKAAGWKVYAGVAPSKNSSGTTPSIMTNELEDPLEYDPCILMLGSEGEGLRWNLRSKADVELAIQGSGYAGGVDSLNVSVAAGILCHSFLKREGAPAAKKKRTKVVDSLSSGPRGDLF
jgi:21S rRNA (GM2251-2'-O)-methyltransferase